MYIFIYSSVIELIVVRRKHGTNRDIVYIMLLEE